MKLWDDDGPATRDQRTDITRRWGVAGEKRSCRIPTPTDQKRLTEGQLCEAPHDPGGPSFALWPP